MAESNEERPATRSLRRAMVQKTAQKGSAALFSVLHAQMAHGQSYEGAVSATQGGSSQKRSEIQYKLFLFPPVRASHKLPESNGTEGSLLNR
jgi:hypothetical protein